jgi:hypothetical protein
MVLPIWVLGYDTDPDTYVRPHGAISLDITSSSDTPLLLQELIA